MSKIIYACFRDPESRLFLTEDFEVISKRIMPDNITVKEPCINSEGGLSYCIINPTNSVEKHGQCVLLGKALTDDLDWWKVGSTTPDGSYSLFRSDNDTVELISDVVASRTIWYFKNEEIFIASSSQRALVMLMGSFDFNNNTIPWILSTGSLGAFNSWDSRIQQVVPDSIVSLNRTSWELEIHTKPICFTAENISDKEHQKELTQALDETFNSLNLNYNLWVLPLSGGFDSRAILCFLSKIGRGINLLKSITWGQANSLNLKGNDAYVAKKVASYFGIGHRYYPTDIGSEPLEKILNRFIICGEGRIDHLGGYMDGFKIWKTLFEDGVQGIIRGDEGLGWVPVNSALNVRSRVGISLCSDYSNLQNYERLGIPKHDLPTDLLKRHSETLEEWRDRLYHQFRIPIVLAALNDLKLPYVEIINPLLFKKIIYKTRQLPDKLRTNKVLFKKVVNAISPDIEYATSGANPSVKNILGSAEMVELLRIELTSPSSTAVFPVSFINYVTTNLKTKHVSKKGSKSLKIILASYMPKWLKKRASTITPKPVIDINILAFRMYLAIKMNRILTEDSRILQPAERKVSFKSDPL
jgi:hypothetical protein